MKTKRTKIALTGGNTGETEGVSLPSSPPPSTYFTGNKPNYQFVSTGCTVLDCVLGGGFPLGRLVNIVGDKSTSKTSLGVEALINFRLAYPEGVAAYRETESAFDEQYAEAMGLKLEEIDFGENQLNTVEDFARDLEAFIDAQIKVGKPGIYVLDSMDALSDEAEIDNDIGKGTYGMAKPKMLSILFRKLTRKIEQSKVLLLIISQVRENIGVTFGEKYRRAGGKALDFYASQILWLSHIKTLKRTIGKVERPYGIVVRSKAKKNKVGLPFRECDWPFIWGYGIDDEAASLAYLKGVGYEAPEDLDKLPETVKATWVKVEGSFLPEKRKYG